MDPFIAAPGASGAREPGPSPDLSIVNSPGHALRGGGECGAVMRALDWSKTSLGPIGGWPAALRTLVSTLLHARQPMFLWWGPDLIQFYNDAYLPSFGVGKHPRAMGQRGEECWPEIWPTIHPLIARVMGNGESFWMENQLIPIHRNGRLEDVYWTFSYSPVFGDRSEIAGTLVVCQETTAQILAQQQLDQAREEAEGARQRLLRLVMNAPAFVCALRGPDHVYEMANPPYHRLLGVDRELIGKPVRLAVPEVVDQGFIGLLDGVFTTATPFVGRETALQLDRSGSGRFEDVFITFVYQPRFDDDSKVEGIDVFGFEVTEQVRARQQAEGLADELGELAEQEKQRRSFEEQLLGIVSHDLRNPLQVILLGSSALLRREKADDKSVSALTRIKNAAERAERMISDLLDFTKARLGGGLPVIPRPFDLHECVRQVCEEAEAAFPNRDLQLQIWGDGLGDWDVDRISQLLTNLLTNAFKYSPPSTPITVTVHGDVSDVRIGVHNEGDPIPSEALDRLFEPFQRATSQIDRSSRSVGLGLYIVKQIVQSHGGTVAVSSTAEAGTDFTVTLPRHVAVDEARGAAGEAVASATRPQPHVRQTEGR